MTMVGTGSLGVLDSRDRGKVLDRVRRGLARQFTGLMAQAVVARFRIPRLRLIVHMPGGLASEARASLSAIVVAGRIDRRRVFRGGAVTYGPHGHRLASSTALIAGMSSAACAEAWLGNSPD